MYNVFWISNPLPLFPLYTFKPGNIPPNNERITKRHDKSDCDNPKYKRLTKKKHSLGCRQYISSF
jgi:hypothetical protein